MSAGEPSLVAGPPLVVSAGASPPGEPRPSALAIWWLAARPKTLLAAATPVWVGSACAASAGAFRWLPALAALLGALLLQVAANFANDVFDYEKGADTAARVGPRRAVNAGWVTPRAMRRALALVIALVVLVGVYLASVAGPVLWAIGIASILSAVAYTGGPYPLGYHGLGDVFVLLFFGFVAVAGTCFVQAGFVPATAWLAAVPVGALATAILVVNNVRDVETDVVAGKRTLPARFGRRFGLYEYWTLLAVSYAVPFLPALADRSFGFGLLPCLTLPLARRLARDIARERGAALNPVLARTALLMFLFGVLLGASLLLGAASQPGARGVSLGAPLALQLRELDVDPPLVNAHGAWERHRVCTLELRGPAGARGQGELAPLPGYSPDTLEDGVQALEAIPAPQLAALEALREPAALLAAVAELLPPGLPAARFALETALLDRLGQQLGQPLWRLLEPLAVAQPVAPVALCALLPSDSPDLALTQAQALLELGVRCFKLKIGPERLSTAQRATLALLRAALGRRVQLRADANRSLARAGLERTLSELASFELELLEEPLRDAVPEELSGCPCPLALDESLQGMGAERLDAWLGLRPLRALVLKPAALGGFSACLELARAARSRAREVLVSHTLESPLGWAACAQLALALGGPRASGLWPLAHQQAALPAIEDGALVPPEQPGLGLGLA